MNNIENISAVEIGFIILTLIVIIQTIYVHLMYKELKNDKESSKNTKNSLNKEKFDITEEAKLKESFGKILKEKFDFYLLTEILPSYQAGKKIESKDFNELKAMFFADVSASITKDFVKSLKKYYTSEGMKLYINQYFIKAFNKIDYNYNNSYQENELLKSLSSGGLDKVLGKVNPL